MIYFRVILFIILVRVIKHLFAAMLSRKDKTGAEFFSVKLFQFCHGFLEFPEEEFETSTKSSFSLLTHEQNVINQVL